jgi:trk system potassium uptake protein TrkH
MLVKYKNQALERILIAVNIIAVAIASATFILLFGFKEAPTFIEVLHVIQLTLLFVFIAEKLIRWVNAESKNDFWSENWYEVPIIALLVIVVAGSNKWFPAIEASAVRYFAVDIYIIIQVIIKALRTLLRLAASGKSPAATFIASFALVIIVGAGLLTLPRSASDERVGFVDSLFMATSATCVTGLAVKDVGGDLSLMGQIVILALIQIGGLGIIIFGVVLSLLLGQVLSVKESVAMQDLLSENTRNRIGRVIGFIFISTIMVEALGAVLLFDMWNRIPGRVSNIYQQWFLSIFHSISAFCNAGLGLFSDNLMSYSQYWQVNGVIASLIIVGGLGFSVLYDTAGIFVDRIRYFWKKLFVKKCRFSLEVPRKMQLQTKIVLSTTVCLIVIGMFGILLFEHFASVPSDAAGVGINCKVRDAYFQSVTTRTAGFNTIEIGALTAPTKFLMILLMFIGGSPGSTAGGIKTVTFVIILVAVIATLRKRDDVEMFNRSIRLAIVRKAVVITLLYITALFLGVFILCITEKSNPFTLLDIMFESASALGTVGLSTGITASLTTAGKLIIISLMFIGRVGPLTLLALLTFNIKPARYNYPEEAVIVG